MTAQYKVVLTGELVEGFDRSQVLDALARVFKQPADLIAKQLANGRLPINQEMGRAQADQVSARILAMGARCVVESVAKPLSLALELEPADEPAPAPAAAPAAAAPTPAPRPVPAGSTVCPKCGHVQAGGEQCEGCGVFFSKVRPSAPAGASPEPSRLARTGSEASSARAAPNPAIDFAEFVGPNSEKYCRKFEYFRAAGGSYAFTWHWPALFVPMYWALYRKLWTWAAIIFVSSFVPLVNLLLWLVWPATANYLYYREAKKKIDAIRAEGGDDELALGRMREEGGTHPKAVWIALAVTVILTTLYVTTTARQVSRAMNEYQSSMKVESGAGATAVLKTQEGQATQLELGMLSAAIELWHMGSNSWDLAHFRKETEMGDDDTVDAWGRAIRFESRGDGYSLRSAGPDGVFDNDDDLAVSKTH